MGMEAQDLQLAVQVARSGIAAGQTPFGAVIATAGGEVIVEAHNEVRLSGDITAHAEIVAIRRACQNLGTIDLSGHVIATTCEPCPMCAAAIHWARLDAVIYGATIADAAAAGFNELSVSIHDLYAKGGSGVKIIEGVAHEECRALFEEWKRGPNPKPY